MPHLSNAGQLLRSRVNMCPMYCVSKNGQWVHDGTNPSSYFWVIKKTSNFWQTCKENYQTCMSCSTWIQLYTTTQDHLVCFHGNVIKIKKFGPFFHARKHAVGVLIFHTYQWNLVVVHDYKAFYKAGQCCKDRAMQQKTVNK